VLLINGVTGELGTSLVKIASSKGLLVAGIGRNKSKLLALSKEFPKAIFLPLIDVGSENEATVLLEELESTTGNKVQMYLHAAAVLNRSKSPLETSVEEFNHTVQINLTGAFVWNKAIVDRMIRNSIPGSLLNVASQAARTGGFGGATAYAASKGGLVTLSKSFARYGANFGIRVNTISPGFVDNPMMLNGLTPEEINQFTQKTALKRLASNEEIANACLFLLSFESSYITAENIEVSAGQSLG
jgi:NAD(P)-dependent dehydrogenase (short-subunit alcohol dehydrogenase family)